MWLFCSYFILSRALETGPGDQSPVYKGEGKTERLTAFVVSYSFLMVFLGCLVVFRPSRHNHDNL